MPDGPANEPAHADNLGAGFFRAAPSDAPPPPGTDARTHRESVRVEVSKNKDVYVVAKDLPRHVLNAGQVAAQHTMAAIAAIPDEPIRLPSRLTEVIC